MLFRNEGGYYNILILQKLELPPQASFQIVIAFSDKILSFSELLLVEILIVWKNRLSNNLSLLHLWLETIKLMSCHFFLLFVNSIASMMVNVNKADNVSKRQC